MTDNPYETKVAERKARQAARADRLRGEAQAAFKRSDDAVAGIPFGQPILVGHHSEGRHRNALKRCHNAMRKGVDLQSQAAEMERRSQTVSRAISSDDPEAVAKLKTKLDRMEAQQVHMRAVNAAYRKWKKNPGADLSAFSEDMQHTIRTYVPAYSWENKGPYAPYQFSNRSSEIRRCKDRIKDLEARAEMTVAEPVEGEGYIITEDADDNRILFEFDTKPSRDVCKIMRQSGFKWSPNRGAWVRMLNNAARWAAERAAEQIKGLI